MAKKKKVGVKEYLVFVLLAWIFAFLSEEWPRILFGELLNVPYKHIWQIVGWPWWIVGWYTIIFTVGYFLFIKKPVKSGVIYGITVGLFAETFLFKKMTVPGFFLFIIAYGLMFYFPFMIWKKIFKK